MTKTNHVEHAHIKVRARYEVGSGTLAGIISGGILSPFDKALYFSIKNHRPLFVKANWVKPFHGIGQTLFYRSLSTTCYFPTERLSKHYLLESETFRASFSSLSDNKQNLVCGIIAGAFTATVVNPTQVIRYDSWINHTRFRTSVSNLYKGNGLINFSKGLIATLCRDSLFGAMYSLTRHLKYNEKFGLINERNYNKYHFFFDGCWNAICAWLATALSSPFNYVRSIQFGTHSHDTPDTIRYIFKKNINGLRSNKLTLRQKYRYINVRLKIGWGTARVALGMAIGSQLYSFFVARFGEQV